MDQDKNQSEGGNVKVMLRVRPFNQKEIEKGGDPCIKFLDEQTVKIKFSEEQERNKSAENIPSFNFDRVFDMKSQQQEIFDHAAKPVIEQVFQGFNGTIFAYGQTSSGKTHTMQGPSLDDQENKGIIPRMVDMVFDTIYTSPDHIEFRIKVSIVEIYMEKIRDLLNISNQNLQIREDKQKGIYIQDVTESYVSEENDVYQLMEYGNSNRAIGATNMNEGSSRSHMIFILTISQNNNTDNSSVTGKLCLVDLAGSEKIEKTGAEGKTLDEAKLINKSLSELGNVIKALTDKNISHIPYRNSKLTRVLQESLGGNARTTLIITASPSQFNELETLSTLRFGIRAKSIKNKPKINKEWTVAELLALLKQSEHENDIKASRIKQLEKYIQDELKQSLPKGQITLNVEEPVSKKVSMDDAQDEIEQSEHIIQLKEQVESLEEDLQREILQSKEKDAIIQQIELEMRLIQQNCNSLTIEQMDNKEQMDKNSDLIIKLTDVEEKLTETENQLEKAENELEDTKGKMDKLKSRHMEQLEVVQKKTEYLNNMQLKDAKDIEQKQEQIEKQLSLLQQLQSQNKIIQDRLHDKDQICINLYEKAQQDNLGIDEVKNFMKDYEEKSGPDYDDFLSQLDTDIDQQSLQISQLITNSGGSGSNNTILIQQQQEQLQKIKMDYEDKNQAIQRQLDQKQKEIDRLKQEIEQNKLIQEQTIQENLKDKQEKYISLVEHEKIKKELQMQVQQSEEDIKQMVEKTAELQMQIYEEQQKCDKFQLSLGSSKKTTKDKINNLEKNLATLTQSYHGLLEQQCNWKSDEQVSVVKLKRKNERILHLEQNNRQIKDQMITYKRKYEQESQKTQQLQQQLNNNQNNSNNNIQQSTSKSFLNFGSFIPSHRGSIQIRSELNSRVNSPTQSNAKNIDFTSNNKDDILQGFQSQFLMDSNQNSSSQKYRALNPLLSGGVGGRICKPLRGQVRQQGGKNDNSNNSSNIKIKK